jgi:hypothetical protein
VAVVYGTGAGVSLIDSVQAASIQTSLQSFMTGTGDSTATGGDSIRIEKTSDKYNLGNDAATVFVSAVDSEDLPSLLADGTYTDDDNTEFDYTQKVNLGANLDLTHFSDTDYDKAIGANTPTPTIGIQLAGSAHVLNYTLDFTTAPDYDAASLETTTMRLMGRDYYVLDVINGTTNKTTFLDSANSALITEGQTSTVAGRTVSLDFISSTEVRLNVDGTATNSLAEGATFKLPDGTYVGVKDILFDSKDSGVSKVEISVGSGKLEIENGAEVQLNDVSIPEITGFLVMDSSEKLDKIVLKWATDDEEFITPAKSLTMPAFGTLKLSMGPHHLLPGTEETSVEGGSDTIEVKTTIKDGAITIPILSTNSTGEFSTIGKDSTNRLYTNFSTAALGKVFNKTGGDKYMVVSWNSTTESESYYLRADVVTEDSVTKVRFTNEITNAEKTVANGDTASFGSADITINNVTRVGGLLENFNFSLNAGSNVNTLFTAEGMEIYLPFQINQSAINGSAATFGAINFTPVTGITGFTGHWYDDFYLWFDTEDKDDGVGKGIAFNMTLDESGSTSKVHVQTVTVNAASHEIGSSDDMEFYVIDDVASRVVHSTGGDYDSAVVTYPGSQSYANLYVSAPETVIGGGAAGEILVKDSEVSSVSSKNLIVVGGSCINSVAANLLGDGARCGSAWTAATGVGSGQFLIQSFARDGKVALLVAGYDVADTQNAVTYLKTKTVDTAVGKKYIGTTATSATLQVA